MSNITKSGTLTARVHIEGWETSDSGIHCSDHLCEYLLLEAAMESADGRNDVSMADQIRDILDGVYLNLTEDQLALLNAREGGAPCTLLC
jgi:hypothetical protein